jgi:hypothetical protein
MPIITETNGKAFAAVLQFHSETPISWAERRDTENCVVKTCG